MKPKVNQPSLNRRKILQGTLAAPMVLTVSSAGAQSALTSAGKRLEALKDYQPTRSLYFKDSPDNWFRKSVPVVKLKYKDKDDKDTGDNVRFIQDASKEDWFYLDPEENRYIRLSSMEWMAFGTVLPDDWQRTKETSSRYLLVWVDVKTGHVSPRMRVEPKSDEVAASGSMTSVIKTNV